MYIENNVSSSFTVLVRSRQESPVVSVIVAMYNNGENGYLRRCLQSIEMQDCDKAEYILVDDCSDDDTLDIAVDFASKRSDTTVAKLAENSGPGTARNVAIRLAHGAYTTMLDSDDYVSTNYFNSMCAEAERTGADCVYGEFFQLVDAGGVLWAAFDQTFRTPRSSVRSPWRKGRASSLIMGRSVCIGGPFSMTLGTSILST